jgi:hypothetical protein
VHICLGSNLDFCTRTLNFELACGIHVTPLFIGYLGHRKAWSHSIADFVLKSIFPRLLSKYVPWTYKVEVSMNGISQGPGSLVACSNPGAQTMSGERGRRMSFSHYWPLYVEAHVTDGPVHLSHDSGRCDQAALLFSISSLFLF